MLPSWPAKKEGCVTAWSKCCDMLLITPPESKGDGICLPEEVFQSLAPPLLCLGPGQHGGPGSRLGLQTLAVGGGKSLQTDEEPLSGRNTVELQDKVVTLRDLQKDHGSAWKVWTSY